MSELMQKLHLPATVYSTFYKSFGIVKVRLEEQLPDSGWNALQEVAEANGLDVHKICALYEPFVSDNLVEFKADDIDTNDVNIVVEKYG